MPERPPLVFCGRCDHRVTVDTDPEPPEVGCECESQKIGYVVAAALDARFVPDTWLFGEPRGTRDE